MINLTTILALCAWKPLNRGRMLEIMWNQSIFQIHLSMHALYVIRLSILRTLEMCILQGFITRKILQLRIFKLHWTILRVVISSGEDRTALLAYIQKESDAYGKNVYSCTLCGQSNSHRTNVMNHVESSHFPSLQKCDYCEKTFKSKNSKNVHISRNHKEAHAHKGSNYSNVF